MSALLQLLEKVHDRESFLDFVRALVVDRLAMTKDEARYPYGGQPGAWESSTIEEYLGAAILWADGSRELSTTLADKPSWRGFAEFLYAGKIYE